MIEMQVGPSPTSTNPNNPTNIPNNTNISNNIPNNINTQSNTPNTISNNTNQNINVTSNPNSNSISNSNSSSNSNSNSISNSSSSSNPNSNPHPNTPPNPTPPLIETTTINFTYVTQILSACPNYDHIISAKYPEDDPLSSLLINWYRDLIFAASPSDPSQLKIIRALDKSLYYYVTSRKYNRLLRTNLTPAEITLQNPTQIKATIKKIIHLTTTYESKIILDIPTSKWL